MLESHFLKPVEIERPALQAPPGWTSLPELLLLRIRFPLPPEKLNEFYEACSAPRRELAAAYRQPEDRVRCLAAGWLLEHALPGSRLLEARDEKGKPYLQGLPGTSISLTHSEAWVACAVHDQPVGVDIERPRAADAGLAGTFMSPLELEQYAACPQADRLDYFSRLWTAKEAYLKAVGTGFSRPPGAVTLKIYGAELNTRPGGDGPWGFHGSVLEDGSRLALCWRRGGENRPGR